MKVNEFLESYDGKSIDTYVDIKEYIPVSEQYEVLDHILKECTSVEDNVFRVDVLMLEVATFVYFLSAYTNLEFDNELYVHEYDALQEAGVELGVELTFKYNQFKKLVDKVVEECASKYTFESVLQRALSEIQKSLVGAINKLEIPSDVNMNDLMDFVKKYK